ncbi:MAG: pyrroloquinoline quinone biosynthesis peptide chaperone PqqD [Candidatus Eremiobacteraeota bacterium]|nr:pyrroloquinoline quinone biosynthesis peptide chaperone PqqD [Candidatus Eremiobacteraeota bacterium]
MIETERLCFARGVVLREEDEASLLLVPEGAIFLNGTAAAIANLIDGKRTFAEIVEVLSEQFSEERERVAADAREFIERLRASGVLA